MKNQSDLIPKAFNKYASLSLTSTIITATFAATHHVYEVGFHAIFLVIIFMVLHALLMRWFKRTEKKSSLWAYGLLNTWLVVGFGLVDGLWNHILRPLGFSLHALMSLHGGGSPAVEKAFEGSFIYEVAGALTFIASMFAAYYAYKFIQTARRSRTTSEQNNEGS
ncbi:MAG: hypothetical protein HY276_02400 [Ignavibacteriales bacterium]|nr:hypothetical protein [Ignavibacteriales bacterium]